MLKPNSNFGITRTLFAFLMLMFVLVADINANEAILTWVSELAEGETQVNTQIMTNDSWSQIQGLYRSREINYSPSIGSNSQGEIMLVWSATSTARSVLRSLLYRNQNWQPVFIVANQGGETTTPAVVFDRNGDATVAWVSDHNGLDDVYIKRWRRNDNTWSEAEKVNSDNSVPDIQPALSLDLLGNVVIQWRSVDESSGVYVDLSRVYDVESKASFTVPDEHRDVSAVEIEMPEDWQGSIGRAVMHFPENLQIRQEKLARFR